MKIQTMATAAAVFAAAAVLLGCSPNSSQSDPSQAENAQSQTVISDDELIRVTNEANLGDAKAKKRLSAINQALREHSAILSSVKSWNAAVTSYTSENSPPFDRSSSGERGPPTQKFSAVECAQRAGDDHDNRWKAIYAELQRHQINDVEGGDAYGQSDRRYELDKYICEEKCKEIGLHGGYCG